MSNEHCSKDQGNSLLSTDLWRQEMVRCIERQIKWMDSPAYKRMREAQRAAWKARPWYERAAIRTRAKVEQSRQWLGEKIAGRRFDDE